jgi:Enoyl-CoA hydratase/carnithine racemase
MAESITVAIEGPVARVTLNRPEVHNAFDEATVRELTSAFTHLGEDPDVRVIVLAGAGKSFSAGADLNWMQKVSRYTLEENREDARHLEQMLAAMAKCPKVTIARVQGIACGGGAGLVAACDIAIASEDTQFAFTEVRLGLVPAIIAPYVLEKVGPGAARALFVSGARFPATEAHRLGLIQQVVPESELDAAVERVVADTLTVAPQAVAMIKRLLKRIEDKTPAEVAEDTVTTIAAARVSPEGQEGIRAFLEKRKPAWAA